MSWITLEQARTALAEGDGDGVRIAVLDSGIDAEHPGFVNLELDHDLTIGSRGGRMQLEKGTGDVFGHGTAVAGILHRCAPKARLGSIRVLGHFKESRSAVIYEGVKQAARLGYDILQCSFGAPAKASDAAIYQGWVEAAYLRGIHIVAAGSNSGFHAREWPAHFPSVIAVGADRKNRDTLIHTNGSLVEFATSGREPDALWPGGGTREVLGSSFAAPKVAGMLARLLSAYPRLHPLTAKSLLLQIAIRDEI